MNEIANNHLLEKNKANFISTRKKRQNKLFFENQESARHTTALYLYKKI